MGEIAVVTVSERGQIVLPKKTREKLHMTKGTKLLLVEAGEKITLAKVGNLLKAKGVPEGLKTFIASEKSLKKDWAHKGDDVWDDL